MKTTIQRFVILTEFKENSGALKFKIGQLFDIFDKFGTIQKFY